jgi:O-antigen/teichoic acid export membrane protein
LATGEAAAGRRFPLDEIVSDVASRDSGGQGARWLTAGLVVNGLANYVFLTLAGRTLGPERFSALSVLWAALYLVGYGLYFPFEQELTRAISAAKAKGEGYAATSRRVFVAAAGLYGVIVLVAGGLHAWLADQLFGGDERYVVALLVGIGGVCVAEMVCGVLAGSGRLGRYALWYLGDGLMKFAPVVALAAVGVTSSFAYGCVIAGSAIVATIPAGFRLRLGPAGASEEWSELTTSIGYLLLAFFLGAVVMNVGTIAVEALASPSEQGRAGVFLSGLVIARVPLNLFFAAQVVLLPRLTSLAVLDRFADFTRLLRLLALGIAGAAVAVVSGAALLGPFVVRLLFGGQFDSLTRLDMALLASSSMLFIGTLAVNQAQIALGHRGQTPWPWAAGIVAFVALLAASGGDLFVRVGGGMVFSGAVALVCALAMLLRELSNHERRAANETTVMELPAPLA